MDDLPSGVPSNDAWITAGERGEKAVRSVLRRLALSYTEKPNSHSLGIAMAFGAFVASAQLLRATIDTSNERAMKATEEMALAYIRGAIRGADEPLNSDGSIFIHCNDA